MIGHNLATASGGVIKIWDIKKAKTPQQYINAHPSKLYTLDFSPVRENQLGMVSYKMSKITIFGHMNFKHKTSKFAVVLLKTLLNGEKFAWKKSFEIKPVKQLNSFQRTFKETFEEYRTTLSIQEYSTVKYNGDQPNNFQKDEKLGPKHNSLNNS